MGFDQGSVLWKDGHVRRDTDAEQERVVPGWMRELNGGVPGSPAYKYCMRINEDYMDIDRIDVADTGAVL